MKDRDIINTYYHIKHHFDNYHQVALDMATMLKDKNCMGHDRQGVLDVMGHYNSLCDGLNLALVNIENLLKERRAWNDKILTEEF